MNKEEEILNSGSLYWFKSQRRGKVAVPLHYLTDEQKKTLSSGLVSKRYELCNPYQYITAHYMWVGNNNPRHFLVTDIEISSEIKRKISPSKPLVRERFSYRITLTDIQRLLNDLKSGEVEEKYIERFLSKSPWKPWVEKEWKLKRDLIIKNSCESCGNQDKLVLQHTIQPRKLNSILYDLVAERIEEFNFFLEQTKNSIELSFPANIQKVPVCPKCGSSQVHLRSRGINRGTYICNKTRNYVVCKHKFIEPDYGYDEKDIKKAEKRRLSLLRDKFCEKEGLLRMAVEISLEEIIIYLNFDHTKTLCNKCAYKEDRPFDKYY